MPKISLTKDFAGGFKTFFVILFLLFNTLSWYYMTWRVIYDIMKGPNASYLESLILLAANNLAIIGSGIIGSIFLIRIKRLKFLSMWIFFGGITSSLPIFLPNIISMHVIFSFLWGVSFGLGMPSCLSYFAEVTNFENRGRIGGLVFLTTNLSAPVIIVILSKVNLVTVSLISTVWRGLGLCVLLLAKPSEISTAERRKPVSFASIFHNRSFILYLVPWFMFSLIDGFEKVVFESFLGLDVFDNLRVIGAIMGTISAFIAGLLSDLIGRKRTVIFGFVSLGIAYAVLGVAPLMPISWYLYGTVDGVAWGIFTVSFFLVLWGDLSSKGAREKYYAIGSIPFFFAELIGLIFTPFTSIPVSAAFSFASLFLFMAVLPLMYAPETLPERKIELRRLRKYLEKAKKVREKYQETSDKA